MGQGQTKDEQLYHMVEVKNHDAVKALHHAGASLEWRDKEGRTPLILASMRGDLYDMVVTLLDLGANKEVYRAGIHGGFPLHHAAKRGLARTMLLLMSRGANPFARNDDGVTPLDLARTKNHVLCVRTIEDRICLFHGTLREMSGPGFMEVIAPQFVTKRVYAVVLPTESDPRKPQRNELVIYQNNQIAIPRTVISLPKADIEAPKLSSHDPTMVISATNTSGKVRFRYLSENVGDKGQVEKFYKACAQGTRQVDSGPPAPPTISPTQAARQGLQPLVRPLALQSPAPSSTPASQSVPSIPAPSVSATAADQKKPSDSAPPRQPIPEDIALQIAMNASILTASAEGVPMAPSTDPKKGGKEDFGGWADGGQSSYGGWGPGESAGAGPSWASGADRPSTSESSMVDASNVTPSPTPEVSSAPSAPPLPIDGPISYPSLNVDMSPVQIDYGSAPAATEPLKQKAEDKTGGQCVVCWDAPAEAVCIPCGHLAGCMNCLMEIQSKGWGCPVCRASIQQVIKVYAV